VSAVRRLFFVYTYHRGYDETDPFIVLATDENEARRIVEESKAFNEDKERHRNREQEYGIKSVEEVSLNESKMVYEVFNPS